MKTYERKPKEFVRY